MASVTQSKPAAQRKVVVVQMTPAQSDDWTLGGAAAAQVEQELADHLAERDFHGYAAVVLDDGAVAFSLEV